MIIHAIVSNDQNISLIFYVKDGSHVRLRHPSCVHFTLQSKRLRTALKYLSLHYNLAHTVNLKHPMSTCRTDLDWRCKPWESIYCRFFQIVNSCPWLSRLISPHSTPLPFTPPHLPEGGDCSPLPLLLSLSFKIFLKSLISCMFSFFPRLIIIFYIVLILFISLKIWNYRVRLKKKHETFLLF